jgi:hypothetical protein
MLSRVESRVLFERVLRGVVIVALTLLLWQSLREHPHSGRQTVVARGAAVSGSLLEWSVSPGAPQSILVQLNNVPSVSERAWLGALGAAGSRLLWSGDIPATILDAQPVASPTAGTKVTFAVPKGAAVVLADEVGVIDTVIAQRWGASLALGSLTDHISATVDGSVASTVLSDSVALRKILVIGNAGWESKFVVAALEEGGWEVEALIRVAPNVDVAQGAATVIDTARYSAVVALDGASVPFASRLIDFARAGGGVVLSPRSSRGESLAILRSGAVRLATADSRTNSTAGPIQLGSLQLHPITSLRSDATPIERRSDEVATAARRFGAGRTLQVGYEDTWRWRMSNDEAAVRGHRDWWTELVSTVAYAPRIERRTSVMTSDGAPLMSLVAAVGRSTNSEILLNPMGEASDRMLWLFALLGITLLGEVMSRRLRGAW